MYDRASEFSRRPALKEGNKSAISSIWDCVGVTDGYIFPSIFDASDLSVNDAATLAGRAGAVPSASLAPVFATGGTVSFAAAPTALSTAFLRGRPPTVVPRPVITAT